MRFWIHGLLGWVFLLLGLALLALCVVFINARLVVEGSIAAFVGIMIFRAGVHFLKVTVAARIYLDTRLPVASRSTTETTGKSLPFRKGNAG